MHICGEGVLPCFIAGSGYPVEMDALLCPSPLVAFIFSQEMSNINTHRKAWA